MYVTASMISEWECRYGIPTLFETVRAITDRDHDMIRASQKFGRQHDITFCILNESQLVVIAKPSFPPGAFRIPSGGLRPGEPLEAGLAREAMEETGLAVTPHRYVLRVSARFTNQGREILWYSHVFTALTVDRVLAPIDWDEISEARWVTLDELQGPIRSALVASGRKLLGGYRVDLTDRLVSALGDLNWPECVDRSEFRF